MIFQARKHFQSLQAVDAEFLEKIVIRGERTRWQLKMLRRQIQDFLRGLFQASQGKVNLSFLRQERKFSTRRCTRVVTLEDALRAERDHGEFPQKRLGFEWKRRACPKSKPRGISQCDRRLRGEQQFLYWRVPRRAFGALRARALLRVQVARRQSRRSQEWQEEQYPVPRDERRIALPPQLREQRGVVMEGRHGARWRVRRREARRKTRQP